MNGILQRPKEDHLTKNRARPLILLIHGIGGSIQSAYIRISAVHLLRAGYPVLRLNLRGAGGNPSKQFYHAGRTEDLKQVIGSLDAKVGSSVAAHGIIPIGISLGGNLLLKYLAECGAMAPVMAAISISAPIDLDATQRRIHMARNRIYHREIVKWVLSERKDIPREIRTMLDFDNHVVAPANGYKDARDYYRNCSAAPMVGAIRRPTLLIHAQDDPWIPAASYRDLAPNPNLISLIPHSGGHVGFHGSGSATPWHDRAVSHFIGALG
jgi:hypothetical protein